MYFFLYKYLLPIFENFLTNPLSDVKKNGFPYPTLLDIVPSLLLLYKVIKQHLVQKK